MNRTGIENPCLTDEFPTAAVRMSVTHEIIGSAGDRLSQTPFVMPVQISDPPSLDLDLSELLVTGESCGGDRGTQRVWLIDVSEHETRLSTGEQRHDRRAADIPAMQDEGWIAPFDFANRFQCRLNLTVGVADDGDYHLRSPMCCV